MLLIGILKWQWNIDYLGRSCEAWESGYIRQPYCQQNIVCIFFVQCRSIYFDAQFPNSCTRILHDSLAFIFLFRCVCCHRKIDSWNGIRNIQLTKYCILIENKFMFCHIEWMLNSMWRECWLLMLLGVAIYIPLE